MPLLYILAGPNGAGKTTLYEAYKQQGIIDAALPFLNIDLIAKDELRGYTPENFAKAELLFRERIMKLLEQKSNFMIESNLAKEVDYDWIDRMIKTGYEIILYFICTDNLDIHYARVKSRVKEGGHDVPEPIIRHRYELALTRLRSKILLFKEAYLIDSTQSLARPVAEIKLGKIIYKAEELPSWTKGVLFVAEKLSQRK